MGHKGTPAAASPAVPNPRQVSVSVPKDADLARLLYSAGGKHGRLLNALAAAADPAGGVHGRMMLPVEIAGELGTLLREARAEADPGAGALAAVAAHFGVSEPEPEPAPAPAPAAKAPAPAPVRAPK